MRLGDTQTRTFIVGIATANVGGATVEIDTTTGQLATRSHEPCGFRTSRFGAMTGRRRVVREAVRELGGGDDGRLTTLKEDIGAEDRHTRDHPGPHTGRS